MRCPAKTPTTQASPSTCVPAAPRTRRRPVHRSLGSPHYRARCGRRNKLVDDLNNINAASEGLDDIEVPIELVQHFIDEGRSPDEYFAQQYAHVQELSESVRGKQEAFRKLEAAVREQGASLLNDDES